MENRTFFKTLAIIFTVLFSVLFIISLLYREPLEAFITGELYNYGLISIVLAVFLLETLPQYVSPQLVILNAGIFGFSMKTVVLMATLGTVIGSLLGFFLGKKYGLKIVKNLYEKKKIDDITKKMNTYGKWVLFWAALLPLPYIPIIFGSLNLKWDKFFIFGLIPRIIGFSLIGLGVYLAGF